MGKRDRTEQPSQGDPAGSPPATARFRHPWRTAVGVVAVAVVVAVVVDWRMSGGWLDQGGGPAAAGPAPDEWDSAAERESAPAATEELEFLAAQTHEELMAAMVHLADQVVAAFPDDPMAYDLQGRIYDYLGRSAEASQAWERCLELNPLRPDACSGLAKLAIKRGDDAAAEPLLRRALEVDDSLPEVAHQLADLLSRNGRVQEAADVLQRYVKRVPTATDGLLALAQLQLQLGALDAARRNFEAVIAARPSSGEAYFGLGTVLTRLGEREAARQPLEKSRALLQQKRDEPKVLTAEQFDILQTRINCAGSIFYAARLYEQHDQLAIAEQLVRQAIVLDPKNLPARQFLISLLLDVGRLPDAIQVSQHTVAADPQNPELVLQLAALNAYAGRWDAAETQLQKVIQLSPDSARGYAGLAEVYLQSRPGNPESVRLAREAVRLEPVAMHYALLGLCYTQLGDLEQARAALDSAIQRDPDNAEYRQWRDELRVR